jgi:TM2 domain-containing membrane protein YozV/DNA-directed RNA polymerase subunit RPC12/RpoP
MFDISCYTHLVISNADGTCLLDYCKYCGEELHSDELNKCPYCSSDLTYTQPKKTVSGIKVIRTVPHKSPGTAALIAFISAIFGLPGIGHIYVGRIGRGIGILLSGFVLYTMIWLSLLGTILGGAFSGGENSLPFLQIGGGLVILFIIMYIGLLIWQTFNARSVAKTYNKEQAMLASSGPE